MGLTTPSKSLKQVRPNRQASLADDPFEDTMSVILTERNDLLDSLRSGVKCLGKKREQWVDDRYNSCGFCLSGVDSKPATIPINVPPLFPGNEPKLSSQSSRGFEVPHCSVIGPG